MGKRLVLASCCLALGACSVAGPLAVRSTVGDVAASSVPGNAAQISVALDQVEGDTLNAQFGRSLHGAMSNHGIAMATDGELIADFALSKGSAAIGVQEPQDQSERLENPPVWISPPRQTRRFDQCEAQELRGTLLLIDRASGAVAYRGKGTLVDCDFDDAAIGALANGLVADFIAKN